MVRAYATNALEGVPYNLVLATGGCSGVVAVLNEAVVFAGANGLIGRVTSTVPAGPAPGAYTICFRNLAGPPTATGVVTFHLT